MSREDPPVKLSSCVDSSYVLSRIKLERAPAFWDSWRSLMLHIGSERGAVDESHSVLKLRGSP